MAHKHRNGPEVKKATDVIAGIPRSVRLEGIGLVRERFRVDNGDLESVHSRIKDELRKIREEMQEESGGKHVAVKAEIVENRIGERRIELSVYHGRGQIDGMAEKVKAAASVFRKTYEIPVVGEIDSSA